MLDLTDFINNYTVLFIALILSGLFILGIKLGELCCLFRKTQTKWYYGLIPFYNLYILCKISWKKQIFWYILFSLGFGCLIWVPTLVCTIIGTIYATIFIILLITLRVKISLSYSASAVKAVFTAIFPVIMAGYYAWGYSIYRGAHNLKRTYTNWVARLWRYYNVYEKCWLITICTIAIILGVMFSDPEAARWLTVVEIIAVLGGCSCELLLSKQSRWAYIVSFIFYDTTQTIVYFANGFYVSALFELVFWIPMLFISFVVWSRHKDKHKAYITQVKAVNIKRDIVIFVGTLIVSVGVGILFTQIGSIAEGLSEWWYLDALANTFSVCNGLFLLFRFREQWVPWIGVAIVEAIMWILSGQYAMLVLSVGYLMNSTYGFFRWTKYAKGKNQPSISASTPPKLDK
mgnify:CR=1 FL=1